MNTGLHFLARHEAGHVVAANLVGIPVYEVRLGDRFAETTTADAAGHLLATVAWAGGHAARTEQGCRDDFARLRRLGRGYFTDRGPESTYAFARDLVYENRHAVDATADVLVAWWSSGVDEVEGARLEAQLARWLR